MYSRVHTVVESRPFAQISNFYPRLIQQTMEVAFQSPRERDECWFITLPVQSPDDMNRNALGAAGAQHRNDLDHFNFVHVLRLLLGGGSSIDPHAGRQNCIQEPGDFTEYLHGDSSREEASNWPSH
jgi:hypothetical protein